MRARRGQDLIYCNIIAPGEWEEGAVTCPSSLIETTSRAQGIIWRVLVANSNSSSFPENHSERNI